MKKNKRKLLIVLTALVVVIGGVSWVRWRTAHRFSVRPPASDELRLVTWNVGYFTLAENKNLRDVDIGYIAETITQVEADVVVLQEVGSVRQATDISAVLGKPWASYSLPTGHAQQVLSVMTHLPCHEVAEAEGGGRKILAVSLESRDGQEVVVVGVHSPHPGRGMDDTVDNIQEAMKVALNRKEAFKFVAGDMNYNFDADNDGNALYHQILEHFGDSTRSFGETYYAHMRIDHVFHYPKDLVVSGDASGMVDIPARYAKVPGFRDHRPIVVTYVLK